MKLRRPQVSMTRVQQAMVISLVIATAGWVLSNALITWLAVGTFWTLEIAGMLRPTFEDTLTEWVIDLAWLWVVAISGVFLAGGAYLLWWAFGHGRTVAAVAAGMTGAAAIWAAGHFVEHKLRR